jgi:hypothetical protein
MEPIKNLAFVGIHTEDAVHKGFYKDCHFTNFSPRSRIVRFPGVFEKCNFNKAEFKLCTLSGSFYSCSFKDVEWLSTHLSSPKFYNCTFDGGNISLCSGLQTARFNEHCTGIRVPDGYSLTYSKDGEYKIARQEFGVSFSHAAFSGGKRVISYDYEFGDEDTNPGIIISKKAALFCSDLSEYKRNCDRQ